MENKVYQWIDGKINMSDPSNMLIGKRGYETVGTNYEHTICFRYGMWILSSGDWLHIEYKNLNSEFKLQLLLMGVT
jgi:hypothetical protein